MTTAAQRRASTTLLVVTAVVPTIAAWIYFHLVDARSMILGLYLAAKAFTVVWPWLAARIWGAPVTPAQRSRLNSLGLGMLMGVMAGVLAISLYRGPLESAAAEAAPNLAAKVGQLGIASAGRYLAFALFLALAHSAVEEIYWRWFLYGRLRERLSERSASLVAALAFASHHFVVLAAFTTVLWVAIGGLLVALMGWLWCELFRRTGSLSGSWLSHVLVDIAVLWLGWDLLQTSAP